MTTTRNTFSEVHREAMEASIQELSGTLQDLLSRRLVAVLAGVGDGKTITRWVRGDSPVIRDSAIEQRMRTAYEVARILLQYDSQETVRAWFIGLNPELDDVSPIEAIASGNLKEVRAAARAFIAGG